MKVLVLVALAIVAVAAKKPAALNNFAVGETQFAANVYRELLKSNSGNFLACPLSANIILALVHAGAKGETAHQISQGLHLPESNEEIQEIMRQLIPHVNYSDDLYTLTSANKVYLKHGFEIAESFKKTAVDVYGSDVQTIDFAKAEQAANDINKWVEGKTHDKIKNLIQTKDLDESVVAVLVNALYFKGKWQHEFKVRSTKKTAFHLSSQDQVEIDMMHQTSHFNYFEHPELKAKYLELPYLGTDVTLTIVLPDDVQGLSTLEQHLDDVLVAPKYEHTKVRVGVPKFQGETTIELKPILEALGITNAFQSSADLTGIGSHQESLKISKVVQKAFIEVDEYGTTAAAATAVLPVLGSGAPTPNKPKEFIADHPFLYFLRSPGEGILFIGRYIKA